MARCFPKTLAEVGTTPSVVVRDLMAFRKVGSWPEMGEKPEWFQKMESLWREVTADFAHSLSACEQEAWRMAAVEAVGLLHDREDTKANAPGRGWHVIAKQGTRYFGYGAMVVVRDRVDECGCIWLRYSAIRDGKAIQVLVADTKENYEVVAPPDANSIAIANLDVLDIYANEPET